MPIAKTRTPQRQNLQAEIQPVLVTHKQEIYDLRQEIARYIEMGETPSQMPNDGHATRLKHQDIDYTPGL